MWRFFKPTTSSTSRRGPPVSRHVRQNPVCGNVGHVRSILPLANPSSPAILQIYESTPNNTGSSSPPVFRGLQSIIDEDSFSATLVRKLEDNYLQNHKFVMSHNGALITPTKYLSTLFGRMDISIHSETFYFTMDQNELQFRVELYAGMFCGLGHGRTIQFANEMAAAHMLERISSSVGVIKETSYALYPGCRHTKLVSKLEKLCADRNLGQVQMIYRDTFQKCYDNSKPGLRWECNCIVGSYHSTARSDNRLLAEYKAANDMYVQMALLHGTAAAGTMDYFSVGVDCPMLKYIHPSMKRYRPSVDKLGWMKANKVSGSQMDGILTSDKHWSDYMTAKASVNVNIAAGTVTFAALEERKIERFRAKLNKAVKWFQENVVCAALHDKVEKVCAVFGDASVAGGVDIGDIGEGLEMNGMNICGAEESEIFHDALKETDGM